MPFWWSAQECAPPVVMVVAIWSGVLGSAITGKLSVFSFSEFWSAKGKGRVVRWVSEASDGVSGLSVFVLSELLEQLAASRNARVSRQKAKKLRGGVVASLTSTLAVPLGTSGEGRGFSAERFRGFPAAELGEFQRLERGRRGGF